MKSSTGLVTVEAMRFSEARMPMGIASAVAMRAETTTMASVSIVASQ